MQPIVMISSWPPRLCGIGTFAEEALEFIRKANPGRPCAVISHPDGSGPDVHPIMDLDRDDWHTVVAEKIKELDPYVVHIEHEYGLYNYIDSLGHSDNNARFLRLLDLIKDYPVILEPHTVHGRMRRDEEDFVRNVCRLCDVVLFKCEYQKWRLEWTFRQQEWDVPENIMIVPHGARPDRRYKIHEVPKLKSQLGLRELENRHVVGLVGWIQNNKRWDILTNMWEALHEEILKETGQDWLLLAAGEMRDPHHEPDYRKYLDEIQFLASKGMARFYKFVPRGNPYYEVMAICDFIVLPSLDETQSGTLARIIALNKPYITTAPMEGLTAQTLESGGGLLFTTKEMLKKHVITLATNEPLRMELGTRLKEYLEDVVSWDVVAEQYNQAYLLARQAIDTGQRVELPKEF